MSLCEHPSKEIIEATLDGALVAFMVQKRPGFSTADLLEVALAIFCESCIFEWAKDYSDHCLPCAVGEWISQHKRVQSVEVSDEIAELFEKLIRGMAKGEEN